MRIRVHFRSMAILGEILNDRGKYDDAEKLLAKALEILLRREKTLEGTHEFTIPTVRSLVRVLINKSKHEAHEHEHELPSTSEGMAILGELLKERGMYNDAEELLREVLVSRTRKLGGKHDRTLSGIRSLAPVLSN